MNASSVSTSVPRNTVDEIAQTHVAIAASRIMDHNTAAWARVSCPSAHGGRTSNLVQRPPNPVGKTRLPGHTHTHITIRHSARVLSSTQLEPSLETHGLRTLDHFDMPQVDNTRMHGSSYNPTEPTRFPFIASARLRNTHCLPAPSPQAVPPAATARLHARHKSRQRAGPPTRAKQRLAVKARPQEAGTAGHRPEGTHGCCCSATAGPMASLGPTVRPPRPAATWVGLRVEFCRAKRRKSARPGDQQGAGGSRSYPHLGWRGIVGPLRAASGRAPGPSPCTSLGARSAAQSTRSRLHDKTVGQTGAGCLPPSAGRGAPAGGPATGDAKRDIRDSP